MNCGKATKITASTFHNLPKLFVYRLLITLLSLGIGCVIKDFIEDDLKNGTLIEIPLDIPIPKRVIGFCYHPQDVPDTLREFLEFCRTFRKA